MLNSDIREARINHFYLETMGPGIVRFTLRLDFGSEIKHFSAYAKDETRRISLEDTDRLLTPVVGSTLCILAAVAGVSSWEDQDLLGRHVKARFIGDQVVALGHRTNRIWFKSLTGNQLARVGLTVIGD